MVEERSKGLFLITLLIMFILFLSMISLVFKLSGDFFVFELVLTVVFLIAAIILVCGVCAGKSWSWPGLLIFFGINLINQLVMYFRTFIFTDFVLPLMVTGLGFLIALVKAKPAEEEFTEEPVVKIYEPGKFVASKTGKKFHAPKCEWAKKIKEDRRVWFDSEKEAKKEGYKACGCVKGK